MNLKGTSLSRKSHTIIPNFKHVSIVQTTKRTVNKYWKGQPSNRKPEKVLQSSWFSKIQNSIRDPKFMQNIASSQLRQKIWMPTCFVLTTACLKTGVFFRIILIKLSSRVPLQKSRVVKENNKLD